jgi:hypothetical protein
MKIRKWINNNINPVVIFVFMIGFAREYFNFANPLVIVSFFILGFIWIYLFEKI